MLRPMANLFAVSDPDPRALDCIEERLAASGKSEIVWRPAPGWLAAQAPLPESDPDGDMVRARGFAFVEGRDCVDGGRGPEWLDQEGADPRHGTNSWYSGRAGFLIGSFYRSALSG